MVKKLLWLDWKSFIRSASLSANLITKIFSAFGALYFIAMFVLLGFGLFFIIEELEKDVIPTISQYLIFYLSVDLATRHFFQKMPVLSIKPLLYQNIRKNRLTHFVLVKTLFAFFNVIHLFIIIPFVISVIINSDLNTIGIITFGVGIILWIYISNFLNILLENRSKLLFVFILIVAILGVLFYFKIFDITYYSQFLFSSLYHYPLLVFIPIGLLILLYVKSYNLFRSHLYLDKGLYEKKDVVKLQNLSWLDQFGQLSTFIKNDVRLIMRNKRAKTALFMGLIFIFYGLIIGLEGEFSMIFVSVFVTGGFMFTFGQFVPSWDSTYYPLMMTQNIYYKNYLNAKWWLIVIVTTISTLIASFYLYFGTKVYLAIIAGGIYNIGINTYLVLLGGAFTRTPIHLDSNKNVFGDKKSFNTKTFLLGIPKIAGPFVLYALGRFHSHESGVLTVVAFGLLGLLFKNLVFKWIESIYKTEKYETLEAYKQK